MSWDVLRFEIMVSGYSEAAGGLHGWSLQVRALMKKAPGLSKQMQPKGRRNIKD